MYPELFRLPFLGWPITTFGVMVALGFLAAFKITERRMREVGMDDELAPSFLIWIMLGGMGGAKLYFAVDTWIRTGDPFLDLFFARGGITWYGGLFGGLAAGLACARTHGVPMLAFANAGAVGAAVGQALGRIGCFLVGDDYGEPSDLPWAVAFPRGMPPTDVPVHPTQLYEVAWLLPVAAVLWRRRDRSPFLIGEYLVANGLGRIVIEQWRVNPEVALGMTEPQWIGVALALFGSAAWLRLALLRRGESAAPDDR